LAPLGLRELLVVKVRLERQVRLVLLARLELSVLRELLEFWVQPAQPAQLE